MQKTETLIPEDQLLEKYDYPEIKKYWTGVGPCHFEFEFKPSK
jgi:hypothetical protein